MGQANHTKNDHDQHAATSSRRRRRTRFWRSRSLRHLAGPLFVVCFGCAAAPPPAAKAPTAAPVSAPLARGVVLTGSAPEIIARHGTGLPAYDLTDAVWLDGLPVVVNSDFDMAVAMMMDDVGPGLAAAQRKKRNAEMAAQLASLTLTPEAKAHLAALRVDGVHRFALFFGTSDALQLRIVTDRFDEQGLLTEQVVSTLDPKPVVAWTGEELSNALLLK